MEGKRSEGGRHGRAVRAPPPGAAARAGQAAGQSQSEYCECFDGCYLSCRNDDHNPRWACLQSCADPCTIFTSQGGDGAARCACETRICESSEAPADAPAGAVCVQNGDMKWDGKAQTIDFQAAPF